MRPKFGSFSRYRPRVLPVGMLLVVAASIVLSNLTYDELWQDRGGSGAIDDDSGARIDRRPFNA